MDVIRRRINEETEKYGMDERGNVRCNVSKTERSREN
jgi:hypothetical protein